MKLAAISRRIRVLADHPGWRVALGETRGEERLRPSWTVVGAQRSGTSSLYEYLVAHPLVCRAASEEIHYFDNNYHRGLDWYRGHFAVRMPGPAGSQMCTGEATPYYMAHPLAMERMAKQVPDMKILVMLRNPVDRAYSHFQHERNLGREPLLSFEEALDREPERLEGEAERMVAEDPSYYSYAHQNFSYATRGRYAEQMERIFALFPRRDVLVISSERFAQEPAVVYAEALAFLELPQHTLRRFPRYSALRYPPMASAARSRLERLFAVENERLFRLLNADLGWNG